MPVETGSSYLSSDAGQSLMTMREFLQQCILHDDSTHNSNKSLETDAANHEDVDELANSCNINSSGSGSGCVVKGYLAQHRLFDQIPVLRGDFTVPDYCALLTTRDEEFLALAASSNNTSASTSVRASGADPYGRDSVDDDSGDVAVNMWFGPSDTQSPLHHDPFHNLLVQVHGYKYVRLYAHSESEKLYPRDGRLYNNSSVDVLAPDLIAHPAYTNAEYSETVLGPGDMLYIPRWCWHFVLALNHPCVPGQTECHCEKTGSNSSTDCEPSNGSNFTKLHGNEHDRNARIDSQSLYCTSVNFWWGPRIEKIT